MGDLFFRNIFHVFTSVTLSPVFSPPNLQICTLSLKPGKKNPNMHMTFYKSALFALKIQQFCCTAFICNQLEGFFDQQKLEVQFPGAQHFARGGGIALALCLLSPEEGNQSCNE